MSDEGLGRLLTFAKKLGLDLVKLRNVLGKPIKVEFVSRKTSVIKMERSAKHHLLICCSASRHEHGDGDDYVQGAGDDTENWAHGLTAALFWSYKDLLLEETNEEDLQRLIEGLLTETRPDSSGSVARIHLQDNPTNLFLGTPSGLTDLNMEICDAVIWCEQQTPDNSRAVQLTPKLPILELNCRSGKLGGKSLRDKLPVVEIFLEKLLEKTCNPHVLIVCSKGSDLSVGVALAILCRFANDSGVLTLERRQDLDKRFIRQQLAYIIQSVTGANPSRATLQSVNAYLISYVG